MTAVTHHIKTVNEGLHTGRWSHKIIMDYKQKVCLRCWRERLDLIMNLWCWLDCEVPVNRRGGSACCPLPMSPDEAGDKSRREPRSQPTPPQPCFFLPSPWSNIGRTNSWQQLAFWGEFRNPSAVSWATQVILIFCFKFHTFYLKIYFRNGKCR